MSLLRINETLPYAAANEMLFDLFHGGKCSVAGREIYLENPTLPVAIKLQDCILWRFPSPVKVSTPGPDSTLSDIRQYRDRIELELWPWCSVRISFTK